MLYFAELLGRKVSTNAGARLGRLTDLVFQTKNHPVITKLVVTTADGLEKTIPASFIRSFTPVITIQADYTEAPLAENELFVHKNLLDQQIIDIKGDKIVRVNDIVIQDKPIPLIAGVDIGMLGILRWFPGEEQAGNFLRRIGLIPPTSQVLSWADIQPLELMRGKVVVKTSDTKLQRLKPEDLADHLEKMSIKSITRFVSLMDETLAAEVIENLNLSFQQSLFKNFTADRTAKLVVRMDPDEAVDILLTLSDKKREQVMGLLPPEKKTELSQLLKLSYTPIGSLITPEFFTASQEDTVLKIRTRIKKETQDYSFLNYIYITKDKQLVGVVSLHELLLHDSDTPLFKFMVPSVVVAYMSTPLEIAAKKLIKYKIEAIPVLNEKREIVGIVTIDDLGEWLLGKL